MFQARNITITCLPMEGSKNNNFVKLRQTSSILPIFVINFVVIFVNFVKLRQTSSSTSSNFVELRHQLRQISSILLIFAINFVVIFVNFVKLRQTSSSTSSNFVELRHQLRQTSSNFVELCQTSSKIVPGSWNNVPGSWNNVRPVPLLATG